MTEAIRRPCRTPVLPENKIALVTGAGSGIGRAVAIVYAAAGAKAVVSALNRDGGEQTVALIQPTGGDALFVLANTALPRDHAALASASIR